MIRLRVEQWERIRSFSGGEADGRPGRKSIPTRCVLEQLFDNLIGAGEQRRWNLEGACF
jgi:hypothetical protein